MAAQVRVFLYPPVTEANTLDNLISRLAWYLFPYLDRIASIELSVPDISMLDRIRLAEHLDPGIAACIPKIRPLVTQRSVSGLEHEISLCDAGNDIVFITDESVETSIPKRMKENLDRIVANGGRYRVDAAKTRQEGSFYLWAGLNKLADGRALTDFYKGRFAEMAEDIGQHRKAYVFGTGPSFSGFVEGHDFSDGLCIVANSIVKNKSALETLKPRIICAADPIYHAGASSYAAAFREALVEALEMTGAWFVCPLRDAGIYRAFLPEHLEQKMVCVPFDKGKGISTDLAASFHIYPFPNVLTLLLLPLASTFATAVHVVGCDGRRLLDDSFFWSHDKKVQFNDEMSAIRAAHPGFFEIDYNDYYIDHCQDLEKVLTTLELHGKNVITETPSLIPALNSRSKPSGDHGKAVELGTFVMIDPDAKDDWGHFLAYDKRLARAARTSGLKFALLSRLEMQSHFKPMDADSMHPVFSVNSWTVGNKAAAARETVLKFARELDLGLKEVETLYPAGDICLFFYVGSIEVAEILEFLLAEHPRVHAVINLFWSYNFDQNDISYQSRWKSVAKRAARHPRLQLLHATLQIAREFARDWDLDLPVLEHPSTTFSDDEAQLLASRPIPPRAGRKPFRVLFPGGTRAEKGFVLGMEACAFLRKEPAVSLALRARLDDVSGPKLKRAFVSFDKVGVEIIDQDLSDDDFIGMIRDADIVVIPYLSEAFRRRTSGILVDAVLLGKPVVVLQDTWLADIVDVEKTGVSVAPDARAIAEGVLTVVRDYDAYRARIDVARKSYLQTNTWNLLVRNVCRHAGDARFGTFDPASAPDNIQPAVCRVIIAAAQRLLEGTSPAAPLSPALREDLQLLGPQHAVHQHFDRVQTFLDRSVPASGQLSLKIATG